MDIANVVKGKGAVGIAIAYFSLKGMVSIPLHPCEYNLIYESVDGLQRIKVISCSFKNKSGIFAANLKISGGNQPNSSIKNFDESACDYVFIVTSEFDIYNIPSNEIRSKTQISLNGYEEYRVSIIPD